MTLLEKTGLYFAGSIILVLLCLIVFSENGILDYSGLKKKKIVISQQIQTINLENKELEGEIISLKTDLNYIKHVAKHEHDMAEEGEFIFKNQPGEKTP